MEKDREEKLAAHLIAAEIDVESVLEGYLRMQRADWDVERAVKSIVNRTFDRYEKSKSEENREVAIA